MNNKKKFISLVRSSLKEEGIRLRLKKVNWLVGDGYKCLGYFTDEEVCVALKNPRWIEVLAHEFSHFIQWKVGSPLYRKCFGPLNNYAEVVEDWTRGKKCSSAKVKRAFETYRAMERECEKITVSLMIEHGIDFDMERYAQEANCNVYMYHFMEKQKIRNFRKNPYASSVLRKMPTSFRAQSHKFMPKSVEDILSGCI
jgi:hypothetical protein